MVNVSDLYGKKVITNTGHWIGEVGEVVIDVEKGMVSHLLLGKVSTGQPKEIIQQLFKNGVEYERVKKVSETIVVGNKA